MDAIARICELDGDAVAEAMAMMRTYYNGYTFAREASSQVYNPTLAIYFPKAFERFCNHPRQMLDANLATDEAKLVTTSRAWFAGGRCFWSFYGGIGQWRSWRFRIGSAVAVCWQVKAGTMRLWPLSFSISGS